MRQTLHIPLYNNSNLAIAHTVTIRSDWTPSDYDALAEMFPNCHVQRQRVRRGRGVFSSWSQSLSELRNESFSKMKKYSTQNLPDIWFRNRDGAWEQG